MVSCDKIKNNEETKERRDPFLVFQKQDNKFIEGFRVKGNHSIVNFELAVFQRKFSGRSIFFSQFGNFKRVNKSEETLWVNSAFVSPPSEL